MIAPTNRSMPRLRARGSDTPEWMVATSARRAAAFAPELGQIVQADTIEGGADLVTAPPVSVIRRTRHRNVEAGELVPIEGRRIMPGRIPFHSRPC